MNADRSKGILDTIATVTMIAASLAVLWVVMWPRAAPEATPSSAGAPAKTYKIGDTFPLVPGLEASGRPQTLIAFVRDGCRFCEASVPFYKSLLATRDHTATIAMSFDPEVRLRRYLDRNGLQFDRVISIPAGSVRVAATPTLLLIDSKSVVLAIWIGQMSKHDEAALLGKVT